MTIYRAFIEMTFEPDENGYLEWEDYYGLSLEELAEEGGKPRTEKQMKELFANELWEYILGNIKNSNIQVDAAQIEQVTKEN